MFLYGLKMLFAQTLLFSLMFLYWNHYLQFGSLELFEDSLICFETMFLIADCDPSLPGNL